MKVAADGDKAQVEVVNAQRAHHVLILAVPDLSGRDLAAERFYHRLVLVHDHNFIAKFHKIKRQVSAETTYTDNEDRFHLITPTKSQQF